MRRLMATLAILAAFSLATGAGVASAAHAGYSLFGDAEIVAGGNHGNAVQLRSDATPGWGGIDFDVAAGTTFADLQTLATDYKFETGDTCGGGSPRFQVNVMDPVSGDEGNIHVYIGPPPGYIGCAPNVWTPTGDLLEGANLIDTSQLNGGNFYDPYSAAMVRYGNYIVTGVQLVADAGWMFPNGQTVFIDNTNIDGTIYTYDEGGHVQSKDDCKDGGWMDLVNDDGDSFKNQGDCVSYSSNGK